MNKKSIVWLCVLLAVALVAVGIQSWPAVGAIVCCGVGALLVFGLIVYGFGRFGYREPAIPVVECDPRALEHIPAPARHSDVVVNVVIKTADPDHDVATVEISSSIAGYIVVSVSASVSHTTREVCSKTLKRPLQVEVDFAGIGLSYDDVNAMVAFYENRDAYWGNQFPLRTASVRLKDAARSEHDHDGRPGDTSEQVA